MKLRINGCRRYKKNEKTKEVDDVIFFYPESYLDNLNSCENKKPNNDEIICEFIIKEKIGEGAFGSVRLGINKQTEEKVAIKILEKTKLKKIEDKVKLEREIEILKKLKHPNIVQLYGVIETERQIFLIMEYLKEEQLFQYILFRKRLSEEEACLYFKQIISGIEYLQKLKIAHRDIKSENMIIDPINKTLKILDFGLSNTFGEKPNGMLSTACGSPCYAAPEMLSGKLYKGNGVDIWSMGVVLFSMICGFLPFHETSNKEMYKKIIRGKYTIPTFVSKLATELIHKILNKNPKKRIKITQIKKDSWIQFYNNEKNNENQSQFNEGLFTNKYVIPIDEDIIDEMESLFQVPKIKSRIEVLSNNLNAYTSLYYLLVNKKINCGKKSKSDFKSDLFISYLKDKNNLLSNYENNIQNVINERKMATLFKKQTLSIKKDKTLLNKKINNNVKSGDNIYNIYLKNNSENKTINFLTNNSSIILANNSNKLFLKQRTNASKNKNKSNLNSYSDRYFSDKNKLKNKTNLKLKKNFSNDKKNKSIQYNYLYTNNIKNKNNLKSLKKFGALPFDSLKINPKNNNIKEIKQTYEKEINKNNKSKRSNKIKIKNNLKYSQDEVEEENNDSKSIEEQKKEKIKNLFKIEKETYHIKKEKESINFDSNIFITTENNENNHPNEKNPK